MLDSDNRYKTFEEVYGTNTTEKDLPSMKGCADKTADEASKHLLTAARVRSIVNCGECLKPRCVYTATKLSGDETNAVEQVKCDDVYTCGCKLFPPDNPLEFTVIVRVGITCHDPMETCYYGATNVHFPDACWYCGESTPNQLLNDEYINHLKNSLPLYDHYV